MEITDNEFLATLKVSILLGGPDLEAAQENFEGFDVDNAEFFRIDCSGNFPQAESDACYFIQDKASQKFYMIIERSEFESHLLRDMLIASKIWLT